MSDLCYNRLKYDRSLKYISRKKEASKNFRVKKMTLGDSKFSFLMRLFSWTVDFFYINGLNSEIKNLIKKLSISSNNLSFQDLLVGLLHNIFLKFLVYLYAKLVCVISSNYSCP